MFMLFYKQTTFHGTHFMIIMTIPDKMPAIISAVVLVQPNNITVFHITKFIRSSSSVMPAPMSMRPRIHGRGSRSKCRRKCQCQNYFFLFHMIVFFIY